MVNASATVDDCAPNGLYKRPKEGHKKHHLTTYPVDRAGALCYQLQQPVMSNWCMAASPQGD